jgi:hypothetical protein
LKVACEGKGACELWHEAQRRAAEAAKSGDQEVAAAGKELVALFRGLTKSKATYTIKVEEHSALSNWWFGGAHTGPTYKPEGVGANTSMDPNYGATKFGVPNFLILTHEAGHAGAFMLGGEVGPAGPHAENLMRTILGCQARGAQDGSAATSCP